MAAQITFRPYRSADQADCLTLFDDNCPAFFAPNERQGYVAFLGSRTTHYEVCLFGNRIAGAFGVLPDEPQGIALRWILVSPVMQGQGLGSAMMGRVIERVRMLGGTSLYIGASHRSAPFFARFGARATATTPDGWGPGMHRVDMTLDVSAQQSAGAVPSVPR
jgi:GNAT superfamily N-acetyltransferase